MSSDDPTVRDLRRSARIDGPPKISELDFRRQIVGTNGLATIFGWESVGWRPAQTRTGWKTPGTGTMAKGWPDLILIRGRDRRIIFAELKSESGRLSDEQYRVLDLLRSLVWDGYLETPLDTKTLDEIATKVPRVEVYIWRPADIEEIARLLR